MFNASITPADTPAPRTGYPEILLSESQVQQLRDWLSDPSRVIVIGSVHPAQLMTGSPDDYGRFMMRVGTSAKIPHGSPQTGS